MKWQYDLSALGGDRLHTMVDETDGSDESLAAILEQIQLCCQEAVKAMEEAGEEWGASEFEELATLIDGEPALCREQNVAEIEGWGFDDFEELTDSRLAELYDLCDDYRVWLGTGEEQKQTKQSMEPQIWNSAEEAKQARKSEIQMGGMNQ